MPIYSNIYLLVLSRHPSLTVINIVYKQFTCKFFLAKTTITIFLELGSNFSKSIYNLQSLKSASGLPSLFRIQLLLLSKKVMLWSGCLMQSKLKKGTGISSVAPSPSTATAAICHPGYHNFSRNVIYFHIQY